MDLYIITENQPRIKEASVASQKDVIDIPIAIPLPPPPSTWLVFPLLLFFAHDVVLKHIITFSLWGLKVGYLSPDFDGDLS
jgi:hypothetical protein